jgi:hypothetical protein
MLYSNIPISTPALQIMYTSREPVLRTEIVEKTKCNSFRPLVESFIYSVDYSSGCPAKIWKEMWECGKGLGNVGFSSKM